MDKSAEVPPAYSKVAHHGEQYPTNWQDQSQFAPAPGSQQYPPPGGQYPPQYPPPYGGQYPPPHGGQYPPPAGQPYPQYGHSNVVVQQPMTGYAMNSGPPPQDHMCSAIFVTLCCFWPTGIIAILKASEARNALARGDMVAANSNAESARNMVRISVIIGIISTMVMIVLMGLYFGIVLKNINER